MNNSDFFEGKNCNIKELAEYLNGLDQKTRIAESLSLNPSQQKAIWNAAKGGDRLDLNYFVPEDKAPLEPVTHWGKNVLPIASLFQKVMCRTSNPKELSGYNVSSLGWLVGSGYFITRETESSEADDHGIVVDYTQVSNEKADAWPAIKPSSEKLGRFVYHNNFDYMRKVSDHVSIGRAKSSKSALDAWMPAYFILCRED